MTDNHQYKNAKVLADAGAATLLEESELTGESICSAVERIYSDIAAREEMSAAIKGFANEDAGRLIFEEMTKLIKNYEKIVKK